MKPDSLWRRIISGEAGLWASPVRAALRGLSAIYGIGVRLRNERYDREGPTTVLPIPVISVGNLTTGGTGKTPLVIELVKRLEAMGFNPAVVSRGYKSTAGGSNDEQRLIQKHCPSAAYLADPDRIRSAETAWRKYGADVIVLDDGFQHRRLGRKLDIVLVDATCPFGFGHLLPRGLLRESVDGLRRAGVVVLSRSDQTSPATLQQIDARLRRIADSPLHVKCRHHVIGVQRLDGTEVPGPFEGKRAVVFAGIGNGAAFRSTVLSLGIEIVGEKWWPDHHHYRHRDLDTLLRPGRFEPHDMLLTTEKDAVKLADLLGDEVSKISVVNVGIDFMDDGSTMLDTVLRETLEKS